MENKLYAEIMINPFDYLYYKLYKFARYTGSRTFTGGWLVMLFLSNVFSVQVLLTGNKDFFDTFGTGISFLVVLFMLIFYWPSKRGKKVIAKYKNESEKSRIIGNTMVTCYVILSIVSFILVVV